MKKKELLDMAWNEAHKINSEKHGKYGVNAVDALDWLADKYLTDVVNGVSTSQDEALNLADVSNNEADLDCDHDITAKVPFKSKKRYKVKVISEVAVCPYCDTKLEDASQDICMDCWNKYRNP